MNKHRALVDDGNELYNEHSSERLEVSEKIFELDQLRVSNCWLMTGAIQ
jgi:hypothetical protein